MNKYIVPLLSFIFFSCSATQLSNEAKICFTIKEQNFGELPFKQEANYSFEFTNPGKSPLVILDVKTSCGCTIANWTKKPVKPNESGTITVTYDSAFPGVFHKEVFVFYNGVDSPFKLEIRGQVAYPNDLETNEE